MRPPDERPKGAYLVDLHTRFVPETNDFRGISLCAGYGGLDLGRTSPNPTTELWLSSSGRAMRRPLSWRGWRTRPWVRRLSGTTLEPLTAELGAAAYISSLPAIPASHLASRATVAGRPTPAPLARGCANRRGGGPGLGLVRERRGALVLGIRRGRGRPSTHGLQPKGGPLHSERSGASHRRRRLFILAHADRERRGLCAGSDPGAGEAQIDLSERHFGGERRPICAERDGSHLDGSLVDVEGLRLLSADGDLPIFAPGPGELQAWEDILSVDPGAQPALLRNGDGMADRVDRTRGAGNGVSSMAAALAWAVLKAAHRVPS